MSGQSLSIIKDSAVLSGELRRDLIAFAIVAGICLAVWAIQTFMERAR